MSVFGKNFLRTLFPAAALAAVLGFGGWAVSPAQAGLVQIVTSGDSRVVSDSLGNLGARIRWGANGWEASTRRGSYTIPGTPPTVVPESFPDSLNPGSSPVWALNQDYKFKVTWTSSTGKVGLNVDFNRDEIFGAGEFVETEFSHRIGWGFKGIQISGNESGTGPGRSEVTGLKVNGQELPSLTPGGTFLDTYYGDVGFGLIGTGNGDIEIEGKLKFTVAGTSDERPSWNFSFRGPAAVPEPGSLSLLAVGLAGLVGIRRRRS